MSRLALMIPYFGAWPPWMELYWHACARNPQVDFYFFTDCPVPQDAAPNLHFASLSFADYCKRAGQKLGIDFSPRRPYKLCDLRPFFGIVHADILKGYSHWGFCDVDLIFGQLNNYVDLDKVAVFSAYSHMLSGPFSVLPNTPYYTHLCFRIKHWEQKLCEERNRQLDEQDFSTLVWPVSWFVRKVYWKVLRRVLNWRDAYVVLVKVFAPLMNGAFKLLPPLKNRPWRRMHFKEMFTTPILSDDGKTYTHDSDTWYYKNGEVINAKTGTPCIFVHFMIFKKSEIRKGYFWHQDYYRLTPAHFDNVIIDRSGFSPAREGAMPPSPQS